MRKVHHYLSLIGEAGTSAEDHKVATFNLTLEEFKSGVIVPANQRHVIRLRPKPGLLRLAGMFFDTNKNFLLPVSIASLVKVVALYKRRPESKVLIVGHTDTSGQVEYNDTLSLERAEAMAAYLTDDVSAWLARYESSVSSEKRWGSAEDLMMIATLPERESEETDPVRKFQDTRSLAVDGIAGPKTRAVIIGEYMARDGTILPSTCSIVLHGCGEHFR